MKLLLVGAAVVFAAALTVAGGQDGPQSPKNNPNEHETGDRENGRTVFRMETFGNEGFWTDAARLPAGMPLLLDLARKPAFLHDDSVRDLDRLLHPSRGAASPHPFYLPGDADRADVIAFLKGLGAK